MVLHLEIAGVLLILLAALHTIFPRYFNWSEDLLPISLINRQIIYVHTFFIGLVVLLMGLLCLSSAALLTTTLLGRRITFGIAIFWSIRLLIQFFGYSSQLWRGKAFETVVHIAFTVLWLYLTAVFFAASLL